METIAAFKSSNDSSDSCNNETCSSGASSSASGPQKTKIHHSSGIEYASLSKQEEGEEGEEDEYGDGDGDGDGDDRELGDFNNMVY